MKMKDKELDKVAGGRFHLDGDINDTIRNNKGKKKCKKCGKEYSKNLFVTECTACGCKEFEDC